MRALTAHKHFRYAVFQLEKGEEELTPHYQGYVEFTACVRFNAIKKLIGEKPHLEARKGSAKQAAEYCKKADSREAGPWENGERSDPHPGKRTDLENVYKLARDGSSLVDIADAHPATYMMYHRAIDKVKSIHNVNKPNIRLNLKVHLFYGPPGCGKTRACYEMDPDLYAIPIGKDIWYDGYQGQKTVLIDDFNGNMPLSQVLRILDKFPIQVPCKGSFCWFRPDVILVTTNTQPDSWYDYEKRQDSLAALRRRFSYIHDMSEDTDCCWAQVLPIELACEEEFPTLNEFKDRYSHRNARVRERVLENNLRRVRPRLMRQDACHGPMDFYSPLVFPGPPEDPNDPIEIDTEETTVVFSTQ